MSKRFSTRVALIFAGWATALAVIFTVMFLGITQLAQQQLLADILAEDARRFIRADRHQEDTFVPASSLSEVTDLEALSGGRIPPGFDPSNPEPQEFVLEDGREISAVSLDPNADGPGRVLMMDTTELNSVSSRIDRHFGQIAGTLVLVILLTAGVSFLAAQHIARPVARLSGLVEDREHTPLAPGFSATFEQDEIGTVAGALDASLTEIRAGLERERTFNLGLSHELRSSLQAAEQALEVSALENANPAPVERLKRALTSMRQASEAVLWLSRPGRETDLIEPVVMEPALIRLEQSLGDQARQRGMTLIAESKTDAGPDLPEEVLDVILSNLVRNAIRHSGGSKIRVQGSDTSVEVEDDGKGLTAQQLKTFTAGSSIESAAGAGLGLILSRRLAERFGLRLELESSEYGTTARLCQPS